MIDVELTDAARDDLLHLREHLRTRHGAPLPGEFTELEDDALLRSVQRAAIEALAAVRDNPWAGAQNRARAGSAHIIDGRHLYFDREGYLGRHPGDKRFRIVYRLEPDEGAPAKATVYAIAERASQRAYAGLSAGDPRNTYAMTGKRKRVRGVLLYALDHDEAAGQRLVASLVGLVKGAGGFRPASEFYVGEETFSNARDAIKTEGFELDIDGNLRPALLENLSGDDLTEALFAHVRRARKGATDAALVTGTGKDLLEATARHVLVEQGRDYAGLDFPGTLYQAFLAVGLTPSPGSVKAMGALSPDAREKLVDALYIAGCAVNTLRNKQGAGHGHPFLPSLTEHESRAAIEVIGTISEFLLNEASC